MFVTRLAIVLLCAAAGLLCSHAPAQVWEVANSGCAGSSFPATNGSPSLGQSVTVTCAACRPALSTRFMVVGAPLPLTFMINPPLSCASACNLSCQPLFVEVVGSTVLTIPNLTSLVGSCLCIQCGCLQMQPASGRCIELQGAVDICVTR